MSQTVAQKVLIQNPDGTQDQLQTDGKGSVKSGSVTQVIYDNSATPYTTTASYTDVTGGGGIIAVPGQRILIQIQENNINAVLCQVLASNNGTDWVTLNASDIAVAKNGQDYEVIADPWKYVKVQVKDAVGGTHGAVKVIISKG